MMVYATVETKTMDGRNVLANDDIYTDLKNVDCWVFDKRYNHKKRWHIENNGLGLLQITTVKEPMINGKVLDYYETIVPADWRPY